MADYTVLPTKKTEVGDGAGNHYIILEAHHTTGAQSLIPVPDGAYSVAELPSTNAASLVNQAGSDTALINPASGKICIQNTTADVSSGLGFNWATDDGVKQIIVDTDVATGTYVFVVRCAGGSAAGIGSTGASGL